jgi:hypothetical protein
MCNLRHIVLFSEMGFRWLCVSQICIASIYC